MTGNTTVPGAKNAHRALLRAIRRQATGSAFPTPRHWQPTWTRGTPR